MFASEVYYITHSSPPILILSETRLLEIVEAACEQSDLDCNKLLEQIEDQVETWWFHRYVCDHVNVVYV